MSWPRRWTFPSSWASRPTTRRSAAQGRARQRILACVDSDAENIFIALTARELGSDLRIVARASREEAEKKLLRAGVDRVISPYKSSGTEITRLALHPQISGAVDMVSAEYRMEELEVTPGCQGSGRTIGDVRGSALIAALRRADGTLQSHLRPRPSWVHATSSSRSAPRALPLNRARLHRGLMLQGRRS